MVSRPDSRRGIFETMLVVCGHPIELDAHLERLAASLDVLFGSEPPAAMRESISSHACSVHHGRLRVTVAPNGGGRLEVTISTAEIATTLVFPSWERGIALRSFVVEGGLGPHKWADRSLLQRAEAEAPAGAVPLLLDSDGAVLEASRGNLFAVRDDGLVTPPADGRILPGIARRRAIEIAREEGFSVWEQELTLDDLPLAEEVFLTGSVGGVEPVRSIDGGDFPHCGEITARIAAGLQRRWLKAREQVAAPAPAAAPPPGQPAR